MGQVSANPDIRSIINNVAISQLNAGRAELAQAAANASAQAAAASAAQAAQVTAPQGGPTAGRPVSPQRFQDYFDTDLGYKVTCSQTTPSVVWVNAVGAPV